MAKLAKLFIDNLVERIAYVRVKKADLADKIGISRQALTNMTSGLSEPNLSRIEQLAAELGLEPFELLMTPVEREIWHSKIRSNEDILKDRVQQLEDSVGRMREYLDSKKKA